MLPQIQTVLFSRGIFLTSFLSLAISSLTLLSGQWHTGKEKNVLHNIKETSLVWLCSLENPLCITPPNASLAEVAVSKQSI